jgi:hypothetical protein
MTVADRDSPIHAISVYLFGLWFLMIGFLLVVGRSCRKGFTQEGDGKQELGEH